MIIIIHLICSIIQNIICKLRERNHLQENFYLKLENDNSSGFDPRIHYEQRYRAVASILLNNKWKGKIKKVADFGCAEMDFFLYLKNIPHLKEVLEIDVDEKLLRDNLLKVQPLISDYIFKRATPLTVHVVNGSISNPFIKLIGTDAVIAIEVIEYLGPDTLDALPYNIFCFIKPKIAIFTTPNADFNKGVSFAEEGNQKFKWTSKQFQSWAKNIAVRFPDYSVHFSRIGEGFNGNTETVGCSQMAVFLNSVKINSYEDNKLRIEEFDLGNCICDSEKCLPPTSFGICTCGSSINPFVKIFKLWWFIEQDVATYKLLETIKFPFREHRQNFLEKLVYDKNLKRSASEKLNSDKENRANFLNKYFFVKRCSVKQAVADRQTFDGAHYEIEQCTVSDELQNCVVTEMESDISTPNNTPSTTESENGNKSYSEWTTIAEDDESDWNTENNTQRSSSWTDITDASQSEAEESASTIVNCLINNVNNCVDQNLNKDDKLSDSGYSKSNTIETISTRSCSDAVEGNSLDDFNSSSSNEEESKNDVNSTKVAKIASKEKNSMQILHNKQLIPIAKSTIAHFEVTTKICKNSPPRDVAGSSLPSTSNGRKKKRSKKFDSEDDSSGVSPPKLLEKQEPNDDNGTKSPSGGEYEEIRESEAMLVENNVLDGNDYLNTQFNNEEPMDETNTENVERKYISVKALLQSEAASETNKIKDVNEESYDLEVNAINAVELASREALFDPNSQVSLLDDFNISNVPYENLDLDANNNLDQNLIFHGINIRTSNEDLALPLSIHPFPNWLLRMLIVDEGVEDAEAHDEPHFYCQGDGLGVHPSFVNEDVDEDTSSDSSLNVSTNDEAEAEPSESEIEVGSLPFDTTSEAARQDQSRLEIPESPLESTPLPDASVTFSAGTSSGTESTDEYFDTVEVTESTNNVKPSNKNCKE